MAFLPAQEQGLRIDWLSLCSGRGSWTALASLLNKRDLDFTRANFVLLITAFLGLNKYRFIQTHKQIWIYPYLAEDNLILVLFKNTKNIKHQWAHFYLAHYMHKKECYGRHTLTWFWVWLFWEAPYCPPPQTTGPLGIFWIPWTFRYLVDTLDL